MMYEQGTVLYLTECGSVYDGFKLRFEVVGS